MELPEFPLLDLGDGFAPKKSTIEIYDSVDTMGVCNHLAIMKGAFSESRCFYDRKGNVWKISSVVPQPILSRFQRFLTHVCYNPIKKFSVHLSAAGSANLDQMKTRIRELLVNDPGDLLFQWTDDAEWQQGLDSSSTPTELFDFITKRALIDHYAYEADKGEQGGTPNS